MTQDHPLGTTAKDMTGQRFGRLQVLEQVSRSRSGQIIWLCVCDCGNQTRVDGSQLRRKKTSSCGCLRRELAQQPTHDMSKSAIYKVWNSMNQRCRNANSPMYSDYGGRGISVCLEWQDSFETFRDHVAALDNYAEKGYSIDRIDNDGDYEPGNVRWATRAEQVRNRRSTRLITYNNKTQCLADWAKELGMNYSTLRVRILDGQSVEQAFTTPTEKRKPRHST